MYIHMHIYIIMKNPEWNSEYDGFRLNEPILHHLNFLNVGGFDVLYYIPGNLAI
jgi:hypothetical protein